MDIENILRKLRPILGSKIDLLWLEYQINPENRKEIEGIVYGLAAKYLRDDLERKEILLVPPLEELSAGDYPLAIVSYNQKLLHQFGLREDEWIQHIGIFGRTGSGKTNVGFLIVNQLFEKQKPFLIFDWKRNYRDPLSLPGTKNLLVFTPGRNISPFFFNPLIPPKGTSPNTWLKKLIEIMCHVYWLGEGVSYLLQRAIDSVYENTSSFPTMLDVKTWLEKYKAKGREAQWMDSTLRAVGTLCYGETGNILNSANPMPIEELLKQNVILELDALSNNDKTFLIESLLLWIHHFRLQEPEREIFKHAIIIEEAHHILLKGKGSKETIMDIILREIRELGESITLIDQHPSLISIPSLGNTYCTITMNLKHARDVNTIAEAMLLEISERAYLGKLEVGEAIVKLQGRWPKPFLVRFPSLKLKKGSVSDEQIKRQILGDSALNEEIPLLPVICEEIPLIPPQGNIEKQYYKNSEIREDERRLLEDVIHYPISGIAERYERLGLSVRHGNKIIKDVVASGLLSSSIITTPEGKVRYLQLSKEGKNVLRKSGIEIPDQREGGPAHEYWKYRIAEHCKQMGYQVEIEKPLGQGQSVDIDASHESGSIAIEIETGKSDAVENINKNLEAGYSKVFSLGLNKIISRRIQAAWNKTNTGKNGNVVILDIQSFMREESLG
jgi:hypothetical protein